MRYAEMARGVNPPGENPAEASSKEAHPHETRDNDPTFELGGFTYTTTEASGDPSVIVGEFPGDDGALVIINGTLAGVSGSAGGLVVEGPGTQCSLSGDLTIGNGTSGGMRISNGGTVSDANATISAASPAGVIVGDSGSTWTTTGTLVVGEVTDGSLVISWGGLVSAQAVFVGTAGGGVSRVEVNGPEASLTSTGAVTIAQQAGSRGETTVAYGGRITASAIEINPTGVLHGDSTVEADVLNEGTVDAGLIPVAGLPPLFQPGTLTVSIFDGGPLYDAYQPSVGDTFRVLTADSISGRFDVVELPTPPDGLLFDVDYGTNAVTLTVVPVPAPAVSDRGLAVMTVPITAGAVTIIRKRRFGME